MFKKIANFLRIIFGVFKKHLQKQDGSSTDYQIIKNLAPRKWPNIHQLKYLPSFLNRKEKREILILGGLSIVLILILIVRLYSDKFIDQPAIGGSYAEGIIGQPAYVNPLFAKSSDIDSDIARIIFSGLLATDKNLDLKDDLAENHKISEDHKTYKFTLRDNIFWHDGQPLTVDDVVFTYQTIQDKQLSSSYYNNFKNISIKKLDSKTIEFSAKQLSDLALNYFTVGIIPKHIWGNIPKDKYLQADYNLKPIGSGPYKFKLLTKDADGMISSYVLESNEKFYLKSPYLNKINFQFFKNYDEAVAAIRTKKIDGVNYSPKNLKERTANLSFLNVYPLKIPYYTSLFLNPRANNFIESKTIRKVLAYTTPKQNIIDEVLRGEGQIIDGPILPDSFGFKEDIVKYPYDSAKAEEILKNAGYIKNNDGFWEKDWKILEISITTAQQPDLQKTAEIIQSAWQNFGIRTKAIAMPTNLVQKEIIKPRNYQILLYGIITGFHQDPYNIWHSSQISDPGINLSVFSNKRVDELLEKARVYPQEDIRKKKYFEFQDIIAEEIPAIFLYSSPYTYLVNKKIKGFSVEKINVPADRFNNIAEWYIKTKKVRKPR